ncbi:hypothetical protein Syun_031360 [Stephania yunnanensis]|uniref:Uncharacterized protein n=1 Tax=Stephania yunnanensis TaxID=152371 RepID=A0AAP0E0A5_9MAGN
MATEYRLSSRFIRNVCRIFGRRKHAGCCVQVLCRCRFSQCYDEESGRIDREPQLHAIANEFGKSIKVLRAFISDLTMFIPTVISRNKSIPTYVVLNRSDVQPLAHPPYALCTVALVLIAGQSNNSRGSHELQSRLPLAGKRDRKSRFPGSYDAVISCYGGKAHNTKIGFLLLKMESRYAPIEPIWGHDLGSGGVEGRVEFVRSGELKEGRVELIFWLGELKEGRFVLFCLHGEPDIIKDKLKISGHEIHYHFFGIQD